MSDAAVALVTARRFAAALDANDFDATRALLAPHCAYDTGKGTLEGPEGIVESYRESGAFARRSFERVEYASEVTAGEPGEAVIVFTDRVTHGGESHTYRCRQRLRVGEGGLIDSIRHEELPVERTALEDFFLRHGIRR